MRVLLLNLPSNTPINRRFMCSPNAANFLFPPMELMQLEAIARKWNNCETVLIDAIAEGLSFGSLAKRIESIKPCLVVSLLGFECFEADTRQLRELKKLFPKANFVCFGYYPTIFPKETMRFANADFVLLNEPETTFFELVGCLKENRNCHKLKGLAFKTAGKTVVNSQRERISDLDSLPLVDHSLLGKKYFEPFLPRPYVTIQSSRGCPFRCNYCVSTYGKTVKFRSAENILSELALLQSLGFKSFRFLDDTFTLDRQRVLGICNGISERGIKMQWSCLSRADTLDGQMLKAMKESGCKRIFVGIESGSQKMLDYYSKGYDIAKISKNLQIVKETGIELVGWFVVGTPEESEEDFRQSIDFAKKIGFDFIVVSKLAVYPGTPLFEKLKGKIDFSLFPYVNCFSDKAFEEIAQQREKKFYAAFYFTPKMVFRKISFAFKHPLRSLCLFFNLFDYLFIKKGKNQKKDLF